jgi:antitoxin (DNA-binding transcriptional repressor) of toxin-antitoxin stability system
MKSIALRQLLREPLKVKGWTRAGRAVQITDHGKPLWILQPAAARENGSVRSQRIDELLEEVLREPVSPISLSRLVKDSRR